MESMRPIRPIRPMGNRKLTFSSFAPFVPFAPFAKANVETVTSQTATQNVRKNWIKSDFTRHKKEPSRSILDICNQVRKKSEVIEGIFRQTRSGVRSILDVCEELRYRRLVENSPIRMIFLSTFSCRHESSSQPSQQ